MTKEEKIKKVYGDLYHDKIDNNGWSEPHYINKGKYDKQAFDLADKGDDFLSPTLIIRPKLLRGLETNNGWTKIESKEELLDHIGFYFLGYYNSYNIFVSSHKTFEADDMRKLYAQGEITHYKAVYKMEQALY